MLVRIGPLLVMFIAARLMKRGPQVPKRPDVQVPPPQLRPGMLRPAF